MVQLNHSEAFGLPAVVADVVSLHYTGPWWVDVVCPYYIVSPRAQVVRAYHHIGWNLEACTRALELMILK